MTKREKQKQLEETKKINHYLRYKMIKNLKNNSNIDVTNWVSELTDNNSTYNYLIYKTINNHY